MSDDVISMTASMDVILDDVMSKSEYDKVIFHNVLESYQTDADVECHYTLTPSVTPSQGDRVGLFRVGFEAPHQYLTYEWAPVPELNDGNREFCVLFKAQDLPMDDGEFYQFCYISAEGAVKGASVPFRFRRLQTEDLIEIEDSDNDLLIIRSRTAVIEEKLREFAVKNSTLIKSQKTLEQELKEKQQKCLEFEEKVKSYEAKIDKLQIDLKQEEKLKEATTAKLMSGLEEALADAAQKQKEYDAQMFQSDTYTRELRETIKVLYEQKEELVIKLKFEFQAKELLQKQLSDTEKQLKIISDTNVSLLKEIETLKSKCHRLENSVKSLEIICFETEKKCEQLTALSSKSDGERQHVLTQLLDTEHMLAAMEKSKRLATEELMAHTEFKDKVNEELRVTKSELQTLKTQHENLDTTHTEKVRKYEELRNNYTALEDKYKELQKNYEDLLTETKACQTEEVKLKTIAMDLKSRLELGAAEYEAKYIECLKLNKRLAKLKKKYNDKSDGIPADKEEAEGTDKSNNEEQVEAGDSASDKTWLSSSTNKCRPSKQTDHQPILEATAKPTKKKDGSGDVGKTSNKVIAFLDQLRLDLKRIDDEIVGATNTNDNNSNDNNKNGEDEEVPVSDKVEALMDKFKRSFGPAKDDQVSQEELMEKFKNLSVEDDHVNQEEEEEPVRPTSKPEVFVCSRGIHHYYQPHPTTTPRSNYFVPRFPTTNPFVVEHEPRRFSLRFSRTSSVDVEVDGLETVEADAGSVSSSDSLPPPIQPEVTPQAKLAAIAAITRRASPPASISGVQSFHLDEDIGARYPYLDDHNPTAPHFDATVAGNDAEDDTVCPVCGISFGPNNGETLADHVNRHFGLECPMCDRLYGPDEEAQLEAHVQSHF